MRRRRPRGLLPALSEGARPPRQAARELGHVPADGRQRRRGLSRDGERPFLAHPLRRDCSPAGRACERGRGDHAARDAPRRHGRGGASRARGRARRGRAGAPREAGGGRGQGTRRDRQGARRACRAAHAAAARPRTAGRDGPRRAEGEAAAPRPGDPARRRRMGEAGDGLRLREDHTRARSQRLRRRPAAEAADGQHPQARRHAQRGGRPLRRAHDPEGPHEGGGRPRGGRPARAGGGSHHRPRPLRPLEDADRALPRRPVVHPDGRARPAGARRRDKGRRADRAGAVCEELPRLARREARLAREPAALVGAPDPDLARGGRGRGRSREGLRGPRDRRLEDRRRRRLAHLLVGRIARRRQRERQAARAGCRRARHLVFVGALAPLHARLAGGDAGARLLLPHHHARHQPRHHHALGGADGDHGHLRHGQDPVHRRRHPPEDSRSLRRDDEQEQGEWRRSRGRDRGARGRRAAVWHGEHGDRDAGRADAGRVSMPALRGADRADRAKPDAPADRVPQVQEGLPHAVGGEAGGCRPAPRPGALRAV